MIVSAGHHESSEQEICFIEMNFCRLAYTLHNLQCLYCYMWQWNIHGARTAVWCSKFNCLTVQHLKYSQVLLCAFKHISCHLIFIMVLSWVSTQTIFKFRDLKVGQNLRSCNKKSQYVYMKGKSSRYTAFQFPQNKT